MSYFFRFCHCYDPQIVGPFTFLKLHDTSSVFRERFLVIRRFSTVIKGNIHTRVGLVSVWIVGGFCR